MDSIEEARRVVRGYRQRPPRGAPRGLLDSIGKLGDELGPGKGEGYPAGGDLERDLRAVATKLVNQGGVSNVAGTLLHGILGQLQSPGRASAGTIPDQPNHAGQIPERASGAFPDPA